MRIALVDFGAYTFTAHLARGLAARGHDVLYAYFVNFQGAKGGDSSRTDLPEKLTIAPVKLDGTFQRYNYIKRRSQEIQVGRAFGTHVREFHADIAIGANLPIEVHGALSASLRSQNIPYIHWLQDIISLAIKSIIGKGFGLAALPVAKYYAWYEAKLLRHSDAVMAITSDFFTALSELSLDPARCHVFANWAPLEDLPVVPKDNPWARAHGLTGKQVLLYSGSMGRKHNPHLTIAAAEALRGRSNAAVVVVAEGVGADYLRREKAARNLDNLTLLPYQPIEILPQVLGSADVLTAFVDASASAFCVPSKLLTYFCAGRAVLAAVPKDNQVAQVIAANRLGMVVSPDDADAYCRACSSLLDDAAARDGFGLRARAYAEKTFDLPRICDRLENIIATTLEQRRLRGGGN